MSRRKTLPRRTPEEIDVEMAEMHWDVAHYGLGSILNNIDTMKQEGRYAGELAVRVEAELAGQRELLNELTYKLELAKLRLREVSR